MAKNNQLIDELSEREFNEKISNSLVVVDFFADWCMPCVMMAPIFEDLATRMKNVKFAKVNVDENQSLSQKFKVMSIPCIIVFKDGKEVDRMIGTQTADILEEKINKHVK
jgi:thioredoxin 1